MDGLADFLKDLCSAKPRLSFFPLTVWIFTLPINLLLSAHTPTHISIRGGLLLGFLRLVWEVLIFLMAFLPTQRVFTFYFFQLSSNSFIRLLMAMTFPLFGLQMCEKMRINCNRPSALIDCVLKPSRLSLNT